MRKFLLGAVLLLLAINVNAELISIDWKSSGDNLITHDSATGLNWLNLTETNGLSYTDVSILLGEGDLYSGYRFASSNEVLNLWLNFGIDLNGISASNDFVVDPLILDASSYLGDTMQEFKEDFYGTHGFTSDISEEGSHYTLGAFHRTGPSGNIYNGTEALSIADDDIFMWNGSYLVQTSPVPIPSAVWLFGSGLLGLIGLARRRV